VDALLESAGLPFCFRTWKSAKYFDGGICENRPIAARSGGEKQFGRVMAFSFNQVWPGVPDSVVKFALSLLDLAITHSVEMAKVRIGPGSVCQLASCGLAPSTLGRRGNFSLTKRRFSESVEQVKSWVEKFATTVRWNETAELSEDLWTQSQSDELRKMMRQIGRIYRRYHARNLIHYRRVKLWVTLSSLAEKYEPADEPVYAHRLLLSSEIKDPFDGRFSVKLWNRWV
jgi:hypothetical protein